MKINLLIGDKSALYNSSQASTGENRHHETEFFQLLKNKVDFNIIPLYNQNLPFPAKVSHVSHHFIHPFTIRQKIDKNALTHIMFGEEASLLKFIKPSCKTVVTCLDLIPLIRPEGLGFLNKIFLKWAISGIKKADHIITNSNFTQQEINRRFKIPFESMTTIYPAVPKIFKPLPSTPKSFFTKYNLDQKKEYILYLGALDLPRKNVKTLLQAWKQIHHDHPNTQLLLIGHAYNQKRWEKITKPYSLKPNSYYLALHDVPTHDLPQFYNLSKLFIFPSLYEGFGLPPAEAMACGTPVITTTATSLPEVVEDAAIQVNLEANNPTNTLAQAITKTLSDPKLLSDLSKKGLTQAKKFTWQTHTEQHFKLYKKLSPQNLKS